MIEFCAYDESFLAPSWRWLNDAEIKRLTLTPDFTEADQRRWFDSLADKPGYFIRGLRLDGAPVGACGLKSIDAESAEYWGYLGDKRLWGRGLGAAIVEGMCDEAARRGLRRVWLRVAQDNRRAVALYRRLGFATLAEDAGTALMSIDLDARPRGEDAAP